MKGVKNSQTDQEMRGYLSSSSVKLRIFRKRVTAALMIALFPIPTGLNTTSIAAVNPASVGSGFTVTPADLAFILKQIQIADEHVARDIATPPPPDDVCKNLREIVGNPLLSFGLRTVTGACNNLQPGQEKFGASGEAFPRLTTPFFKSAEPVPAGFPGAGSPTTYACTVPTICTAPNSMVFDSQPRMISNLIVDQTAANPAARAAAEFPVRTQGNPGVVSCTIPGGDPGWSPNSAGCVAEFDTLDIPNVTTDFGLSPPFNSLFTIFGQFFDHGLDKITNGGNGLVFVPLKLDDPLVAGADHIIVLDPFTGLEDPGSPFNADNLAANKRFMVLTRSSVRADSPPGGREATNTDTPFVDQSQTYTSHPSHQVFLREYELLEGKPVATGKFLHQAAGDGMPTWAMVKTQARDLLGIELTDADVGDIPLIATDPYGRFLRGLNGFPQVVFGNVLVEGNPAAPISTTGATRIGIAFLNDIAHSAAPKPGGPDADLVAGSSLATPVPAGTYDNELLDIHFIAGDGRVNENIGLTAVHQIFHSEHDRLVEEFKETLTNAEGGGITHLVDWQLSPGIWNGERLFQAARFVTEMEYQHLVFEEFARKVQPAINPFEAFALNQSDVNSAITAEFAHAVYRFGHSMLNDTIPRITPVDGSLSTVTPELNHFDIPLLEGFLNPAAYTEGPNATTLTHREAATAIIMGLSDQAGQEIDEFVVETLRNNLLGLPLDLPTINMTRARSEGIPSLNNLRKQIFARTGDGQLAPYGSWMEFAENLRHLESLVNFIAAYGTHPDVTAESTVAGKRAAANLIVNGGLGAPTDRNNFLFSAGPWVNVAGVSQTGLDEIDLWMGGLAENTNPFGGLLGPTFNYVFETQMTQLQNGDRFYYLARTPGMNLRGSLEGNSFSELVMRNTNSHTLKADPFATADCKFQLANLKANPAGFLEMQATYGDGSFVENDDTTECDESAMLLRLPDGTIKFRAKNTVNGINSGVNAQSVYNGTADSDRFYGGNDNDTFWGGLGQDFIEGGSGDDVALGGLDNDIITDFAGDDFLKGGPGNDAIDAGIGLDIIIGGDGKDFINGGGNSNETFAGPGDDFVIAGTGIDAVFGDSGDDWMEGGDMPDLLIGDSSTLFFDDHNVPGHDIMMGQGGDDDYDAEGGDDILVAGPGIEKNAGAAGYDWSIGLWDPQPQVVDLTLKIVAEGAPVGETRDRFNEVEALSGWTFNDILKGDDLVPAAVGGAGAVGCDALDQDGLDRISGLDDLVPTLTTDPAPIAAAAATAYCMLDGLVWGAGNIILGGAGSDIIEGRGGDDIIDGDRFMMVRLSVRDPGNFATQIGTTGLMEDAAWDLGDFGPGTTGMTLQQAVFSGNVDPGNIVAVREILDPGPGTDVDTAVFSAPLADYDITVDNTLGSLPSLKVVHARGSLADGTDTLRNIEILQFCDIPGAAPGTCLLPSAPIAVSFFTDPPIATVTPALAFGDVNLTTLAMQLVNITNTGGGSLNVLNLSITGDTSFTIAGSTCGGVLAGNQSCVVSVNFAPATLGLKAATLQIDHNATGSPALVALSGTGVTPIASLSSPALEFGSLLIPGTSASQSVTVTNVGTSNLVIPALGVTKSGADQASFNLTDGCSGQTLSPAATCVIDVTFTASIPAGVKTAQINIASNAIGSPAIVSLSGTALGLSIASLSSASLDLGSVPIEGTSASQSVTVTNTGTANLIIGALGVTKTGTDAASFNLTDGCSGQTVAPAATCVIGVTYTASAPAGAKTAQINIASNAADSPAVVSLSATALGAPIVSPSSTALAFGSVLVSLTSAPQNVTVTNIGTADLVIPALGVTKSGTNQASFNLVDGCSGQTVAPAAACVIGVTFTASAPAGAKTAQINIASNAAASPAVVSLSGTAVASTTISLPATVAFGIRPPGTVRTQNVRLTNTGASPLIISGVSVTGSPAFSGSTGNCPATLAVGRSCNLTATFTVPPIPPPPAQPPPPLGAVSGALKLLSPNKTNDPTTVLTGTGR